MHITTRALVLRAVKFKESDKMLTVLTEDEGKLGLRVRGALRKGSRFAAATEVLTFSEMTLFGHRGRWSLDEAAVTEQFLGLRDEISRLALASYFAEMLEAASDEDNPNKNVLQLGLNSLFALSGGLFDPEHIKAVFEMRLMCLLGYEPLLTGCAVCGKVDITNMQFSISAGVLHCSGCRPAVSGVSVALCRDSLAGLRYIIDSEAKRIFSFQIEGDARARLYELCEGYSRTQLERNFDTLSYWKSVKNL